MTHIMKIDEFNSQNVNENWINKLLDIGKDNYQLIKTIRTAIEELRKIDKSTLGNLEPMSIKYDKEKQVIYYDGNKWNEYVLGPTVILKNVPYKNMSKREFDELFKRLEKSPFWRGFKERCKKYEMRQEELKRMEEEEKHNPVIKYEDHADSDGWDLMKEGGIKRGDRYWFIRADDITKFNTGKVNKYYFGNEAGALWAAEMFKCGYGAVKSDTM